MKKGKWSKNMELMISFKVFGLDKKINLTAVMMICPEVLLVELLDKWL